MKEEKRRNVDPIGISVIEMPIRPTLGIMCTWHNISGAWLLTPLRAGTIVSGGGHCVKKFKDIGANNYYFIGGYYF